MRVVFDKITKEIIQVIEDENSITYFPEGMGVIQCDADDLLKMSLAVEADVKVLTEEFDKKNVIYEKTEEVLDAIAINEIK